MIECDENLFLFLNHLFATPFLTWFFSRITWLGNGWTQIFLVVPVMVLFSREKFKSHFAAILLTTLVSGFLVTAMKVAVDRPRPPEHFADRQEEIHTPEGLPVSRSFPSGHTQTAFATAGYLSFLYPLLSPVLLALAVLVGLSRIALGVHFPLDVLAGAVIGIGSAAVGFRINRSRLARRK